MNSAPKPPQSGSHDDGLEWLREIRRQISAEHGHDQSRIGEAIRVREAELKHRLVRTQDRVIKVKSS